VKLFEILKKALLSLWHLVPVPTGRSYVLVSLCMTLFSTSFVAYAVYYLEERRGVRASYRSEFIANSEALDTKVSTYLGLIAGGKSVDGVPSQDIVNNLIEQYHSVEHVADQLEPADRHLIGDYQNEISKLKQDIPESADITHTSKFLNDFRKILLMRETLRDKLNA
jgi:hypothetical protein